MWEAAGDLARAIEVYDTGFQPLAAAVDAHNKQVGSATAPTRKELQRGAGVAMKLGDLWAHSAGPNLAGEAVAEAERYYSWAVQELMRLNLTDKQREKVKTELATQDQPLAVPVPASTEAVTPVAGADDGDDMKLPGWVGEVELVAAMERLGDLYSRTGKIECVARAYPSRAEERRH